MNEGCGEVDTCTRPS